MNTYSLMSRASGEAFSHEECTKDLQRLIEETTKDNYHDCIVYLLVLKEHIVEIKQEKKEEFERAFEEFKAHAKSISEEEWHRLIDKTHYITHKEEKIEENRSVFLINLVIETLIRTGAAEIERAIEVYLEEEMKDPRTQTQKNISSEIVEEILENITKLSESEQKSKMKMVSKLLTAEHIPIIMAYVHSLSKVLLISLYVNNRDVYSKLLSEFTSKAETSEEYLLLEHFPEIDIDQILQKLDKSTSIFKLLDRIIKTRLIYQDRIVDHVISYIKKGGSRTKAIGFIKDNLSSFIDKVRSIGLGCEEVLLLADKDNDLLQYVFVILHSLKNELKEKRVINYQKKEKRLSLLISAISTELSNLPEEVISRFIEYAHRTDPDLLSKICIGLFRLKQPSEELVDILTKIVSNKKEKTTTSFVFTSLPYLKERQKYELIEEYLVDDVSLTLFLRMIRPEDIFMYAHGIDDARTDTEDRHTGEKILNLCWNRPEVFTDRVISLSLENIVKMRKISSMFGTTVRKCLKKHTNMKPFVVNLVKREWKRLFAENKKEITKVLELLGVGALEILLSIEEKEMCEILKESKELKERMEEYLSKQPKYIREKYKRAIQ